MHGGFLSAKYILINMISIERILSVIFCT